MKPSQTLRGAQGLDKVSEVTRYMQTEENGGRGLSEVNGSVLIIRDALGFNLAGENGSVGLSQKRTGAGQVTSTLRVENDQGDLALLEASRGHLQWRCGI